MPCRKVSMSTLQGKQNANAHKRELLCRRKKPEEFTNSSCTSTRTVIRTLMISKLQELSNESRDLGDAIAALELCGSQGPGRGWMRRWERRTPMAATWHPVTGGHQFSSLFNIGTRSILPSV